MIGDEKMKVIVNIISAILKFVAADKVDNKLVNEVIGTSIDGLSKKEIDKINDFIIKEKMKIEHILSKENMRTMNISEEYSDFVVFEIKNLFSRIDITDEVIRQCKYDNTKFRDFLWNEYCRNRHDYIDCENEIKRCLFVVANALIELVYKSEDFDRKVLIDISNSVDDVNVGLQKTFEYLKDNLCKLDANSQIMYNILWLILEQFQKINVRSNGTQDIAIMDEKFKNNKKKHYIENWNSRLFLHMDDEEKPLTLAEVFIMPDFDYYVKERGIKFSDKDTLDNVIEKFISNSRSSNMLIMGEPGIGKSSIVSWMANKYKDNDEIIILRFRDWEKEEIEKGVLKGIYNTLGCEKKQLENTIIILDGFDEIKAVDMQKDLLHDFFNDILDFKNFKFIITSRPGYINYHRFQNAFEILPFNIIKIKQFYRMLRESELEQGQINLDNIEVLGIPVILYMCIMSEIDITEKSTKPELYNRIFAKEGGIFDKFCTAGIGYDDGMQLLRDIKNTEKYLSFMREIAFKMFEKDALVLPREDYQIPVLEYKGKSISVLEFPIKHLFENTMTNIEFIHKSIYEYFMSEYIFLSICEIMKKSKEELASMFGKMLKSNVLSSEIIEFLKYRIKNSELNEKFNIVNEVFRLMLQDGMTYYTNECYKNVIECEMRVFANMLDIIHIWDNDIKISNVYYLRCNKDFRLDLRKVELKNYNLRKVYLKEADLCYANLMFTDLSMSDISNAKFNRTNLRKANLSYADLRGAIIIQSDLTEVNLSHALLIDAHIIQTDLSGANLSETIFDENQIQYLEKEFDLKNASVYIRENKQIISYNAYCNYRKV